MRHIFLGILIVAATMTDLQGAGKHSGSEAVPLPQFWDSGSKEVSVPSPNGKLVLKVQGKRSGKAYPEEEYVPDYFLEENGHRLKPAIHPYNTPQALWSPSSNILAITSSDGGLSGNWKVYTYKVSDGNVVTHDVMPHVQADLAAAFPGGINPPGKSFFSKGDQKKFANDPSWVNVRAVHWLKSPERLLVVASVPPSSSYGINMDKRRGYVIDPITGAIIQSFDDAELKHLWGEYLGD